MRRVFYVLILNFPRFARMGAANYRALRQIRAHKYASAEKSLLRVYELLPPGEEATAPINLSMCLVSLRLGNPAAAAELALKAIRQAKVPGAIVGASAIERDYIRYYGKLIYEEATRLDEAPMTIDVGVESKVDLDLEKVSWRFKDSYPLSVVQPPPVHTLH